MINWTRNGLKNMPKQRKLKKRLREIERNKRARIRKRDMSEIMKGVVYR